MLDIRAFEEFLSPEGLETLKKVVDTVGSMAEVRKTLTGRIMSAGRVPLPGVMEVVDSLKGTNPNTLLHLLANDANGSNIIRLEERKDKKPSSSTHNQKKKPKPKKKEFLLLEDRPGFVQQMTVDGEPTIVSEMQYSKEKDGTPVVVFRLMPVWLFEAGKERFTWTIRLKVPHFKRMTEDGHGKVWFEGRQERFFRPRFVWRNGDLTLEGMHRYFQLAVFEEVKKLPTRSNAKTKSSGKAVEEMLNRAISRAMVALPMSDDMGNLVMRSEFEIVIEGVRRVTDRWRAREEVLRKLVGEYDINCTSKNHPGDIITKPGMFGVPSFILVFSPFAMYMDKKREPEMRELRKSLELTEPTPLSVRLSGLKMPDALAARVRDLRVVMMDCQFNYHAATRNYEEFCHDTLMACPSFLPKMKILRQRFEFADPEELSEMRLRLAEMGIPEDDIEETTIRRDLDNGLAMNLWRLEVKLNREDLGKVKSLGAIKGVPIMAPCQLFAVEPDGSRVEIDMVVPESTFVDRKKCVDAMLYMMAGKAGVHEVEPEFLMRESLREVVGRFQHAMERNGYDKDGKQEILAIYPDDPNPVSLGRFFVGMLPFYRPVQTAFGQFRRRSKMGGINIHLHDLQMIGLSHEIHPSDEKRFAQLVQASKEMDAVDKDALLERISHDDSESNFSMDYGDYCPQYWDEM